jgi:hypothetical protein
MNQSDELENPKEFVDFVGLFAPCGHVISRDIVGTVKIAVSFGFISKQRSSPSDTN